MIRKRTVYIYKAKEPRDCELAVIVDVLDQGKQTPCDRVDFASLPRSRVASTFAL
jgi:hypothetical protein